MEKVPLCVVGCGGMGHRHILAYKVLEDSGIGNVELMAVCDVNRANAEFAAREVQRLFGREPLIFTDMDSMLKRDDILAVDVVTDVSVHHQVAVPALLAGKHALVEKPLGITMRACQAMIDAARTGNAVLATAENYRRDPPNRLARAVVESGLLGEPFLMMQTSAGGSDRITITPCVISRKRGPLAWTWASTTATSSNTTWGTTRTSSAVASSSSRCDAGPKGTTITPSNPTASGPRPIPRV